MLWLCLLGPTHTTIKHRLGRSRWPLVECLYFFLSSPGFSGRRGEVGDPGFVRCRRHGGVTDPGQAEHPHRRLPVLQLLQGNDRKWEHDHYLWSSRAPSHLRPFQIRHGMCCTRRDNFFFFLQNESVKFNVKLWPLRQYKQTLQPDTEWTMQVKLTLCPSSLGYSIPEKTKPDPLIVHVVTWFLLKMWKSPLIVLSPSGKCSTNNILCERAQRFSFIQTFFWGIVCLSCERNNISKNTLNLWWSKVKCYHHPSWTQ